MAALSHWLKRARTPEAESPPTPEPSAWRIRLQGGHRLVEALMRDVSEGGLDLRATSLVYTTLLSMAPLLAVSFSMLKAFGAHNQMRPFLLQMLDPLGEQASEIADRIIGFVNNMEVGVLGFTGFALLFYTVLSLLQKIEDSFNQIWRVEKSRGLRRRFSDYLSVLLVGPVLVFSALGLMASMASHKIVQAIVALEPFGTLYYLLGLILPTLFMIAAFTFLYLFIPNTRVRFKAALAGGIAAGLAWRLVGWLFAEFVAGSAQYEAIYSSFAILIVFMIWLYVNWLILLLGVDISFYVQHSRYLRLQQHDIRLGYGLFRRIGLSVMYLLAERFHRGEPPWTVADLSARLDLPHQVIERVLETLQRRSLVLAVDRERMAYMPAREPCVVPITDVLEALESGSGDAYPFNYSALAEPAVERLASRLREAGGKIAEGMTLKDFIESAAPP
jgi:membrane protein